MTRPSILVAKPISQRPTIHSARASKTRIPSAINAVQPADINAFIFVSIARFLLGRMTARKPEKMDASSEDVSTSLAARPQQKRFRVVGTVRLRSLQVSAPRHLEQGRTGRAGLQARVQHRF